MVEQKKRDEILDIARGVAILCVVWAHVIQWYCNRQSVADNELYRFIYSFHMPLFMTLSGYLFYCTIEKYGLLQIIKKRVIGLGEPGLLWGTIYFLFNMCVGCPIYQVNVDSYVECVLNVWFLWTLLFHSIVVALAEKLKSGKYRLAILLLAVPVMLVQRKATTLIYMYPYFLIGFYYSKNKEKVTAKFGDWKYILAGLFPLLLQYFKGDVMNPIVRNPFKTENGILMQTGMIMLRYLIGLAGVAFVFLIIRQFRKNERQHGRILGVLGWFGQVSLQIYVVQRITVELVGASFGDYLIQTMDFNLYEKFPHIYSWIFAGALAILNCLFIGYVVKILDKVPYINKILFAR